MQSYFSDLNFAGLKVVYGKSIGRKINSNNDPKAGSLSALMAAALCMVLPSFLFLVRFEIGRGIFINSQRELF